MLRFRQLSKAPFRVCTPRLYSTQGTEASKSSGNMAAYLTVAAVAAGGAVWLYNNNTKVPSGPPPTTLVAGEFVSLKLKESRDLTPTTKLFRFDLPSEQHELGLPVAGLVLAKVKTASGEDVVRPYTPISEKHAKGHMDLAIKIYPNGKFGQAIKDIQPGQTIEVKGPLIKYEYKPNEYKKIGMLAGGSGITPMLQVVKEILNNPEDKTQVTLLFANTTDSDIILKDELDRLAQKHSDRFSVKYFVSKAPSKDWNGLTGYITADHIKQYLPSPSENGRVLVCGPPAMMTAYSGPKAPDFSQGELSGLLAKLGYNKDQVFKY